MAVRADDRQVADRLVERAGDVAGARIGGEQPVGVEGQRSGHRVPVSGDTGGQEPDIGSERRESAQRRPALTRSWRSSTEFAPFVTARFRVRLRRDD